MQAIEIVPPGVLTPCQRPVPEPKSGEVLIRVRAAGVNRPDLLQRQGKYPPPPGITDIPGLEVAGDVVYSPDLRFEPGDQVSALLAGGGYAEYAVVPVGQCLPVPKGLSIVEAAALPETVFTVWNNVFVRGRLQRGETLLIHGGSSGIGTTAIQMARAHGAHVIVTAGTDEKCAACLKLGADRAINYKAEDFGTAIPENSVNVVLDMVGGDYVPRNLKLLATDGHHVSIATLQSSKTEIDLRTIMQKRISLTGSTLRPRPAEEKERLANGIYEIVWPWIEQGLLKPLIHATFPLAEAQKAHDMLEAGNMAGKIVLTVAA